jgi:hypothetical protein
LYSFVFVCLLGVFGLLFLLCFVSIFCMLVVFLTKVNGMFIMMLIMMMM